MNIQTEKYQLIEWIIQLQDQKIIKKLLNIANETDWWDSISQAERDSINRGLRDIEEGKVYSHSEAKNIYEKYL